jgi:hypothetical protein
MTRNDFSNLNFDRPQRRIPGRAIWMGILLASVGVAWIALPPGTFLWLNIFLVGILGWAASYSWRESLEILIRFLDQLRNL